jgi:3-oxoacyl-[acyl-carrier protein] reductase
MRIVITGGATGIGRACADRFIDDGHQVVLVGRRQQVLDDAVRALGANARALTADATDPAQVAIVAAELDAVDVLVCAAGGTVSVSGDGLPAVAGQWVETYKSNVLSAVLMSEALMPVMRRPGGRIVAISSVSGRKGAGSYGAAKAALNNWVIDLATALAADGITINAVAPGYVPETEFWDGRRDDAEVERRLAKVAMGRPGQLEEIAHAVASFASPLAGFTTGQVLGVDGGTLLSL